MLYEVITCYAAVAIFRSSGNRSHHSRPRCLDAGRDIAVDSASVRSSPAPDSAQGGVITSYSIHYTKLYDIPGFICPSRRKAISYPAVESSWNADQPGTLNKTDYAANGGTHLILGTGPSSSYNFV